MSDVKNELKRLVTDFESVQSKWREVGATDTEPDGYFHVLLKRAFQGKLKTFPTDPLNWELYDDPKHDQAASELFAAAKQVTDFIQTVPLGQASDVKRFLESYCWRVEWY